MDDTDPGMEMAGGGGWGQLPEDSSGSLDTAQGWGLTSAAPLCLPACSQQWLASLSHWRPATRGGVREIGAVPASPCMAPTSPCATQHSPSTHSPPSSAIGTTPQPQRCGSPELTMFSRKAGTRVALGSTTKASAEPKRAPCRALGWQESRGCRRAQRCSSMGRLGKCCCSWQREGWAGTELPWHCQHPAAPAVPQPGSDNAPHPAHIPAASHPVSHLPASQHSCVLSQLHLISNPIPPTSHPMPHPACTPSQVSHPSRTAPHGCVAPTPFPPAGQSCPCSLCSASGGSAAGAGRQQRLGCWGHGGTTARTPWGSSSAPIHTISAVMFLRRAPAVKYTKAAVLATNSVTATSSMGSCSSGSPTGCAEKGFCHRPCTPKNSPCVDRQMDDVWFDGCEARPVSLYNGSTLRPTSPCCFLIAGCPSKERSMAAKGSS